MDLTQNSFDELLDWLDPDRDKAGVKYERVRSKLITIFTNRGCTEAEDLADETINRVGKRVSEIRPGYVGDPMNYFYGVANKIHLEYCRKPRPPIVPEPVASLDYSEEFEMEYECLLRCIQELSLQNRDLVVRYYQGEKRAKINCRKELAKQMGIALNALRIRAYRLRAELQRCVAKCVREMAAA